MAELGAVVEAAGGKADFEIANSLPVGPTHAAIVKSLRGKRSALFLGHMVQRHPAYARIRQLAAQLAPEGPLPPVLETLAKVRTALDWPMPAYCPIGVQRVLRSNPAV